MNSVVPKHLLNELGGVYTSRIWNNKTRGTQKKIVQRRVDINLNIRMQQIFRTNPNKSSNRIQRILYRRMFTTYQPVNHKLLKSLRIKRFNRSSQ